MQLKNKILITILFFLLLILFFNINNVFATEFTETIKNKARNIVGHDNFIVIQDTNGDLILPYCNSSSCSSGNWKYKYDTSNSKYMFTCPNGHVLTGVYKYSNNNFQAASLNDTFGSMYYAYATNGNHSYVPVYSYNDITYLNASSLGHENGEVFYVGFYQPEPEPVEEPEPETPEIPEEIQLEGTLAPIVAEIPETKEILQEIIQMLPVILSVLVSLVALRKALAFLMGHLRTS